MNEAVRRLAGYLLDQPEASRSDAYANAMRNSGAARMLLPYRIHRAGYADAVAEAQAAVGTADNPVTGLDIVGGELVVTFADGSTESHTLPAGMGGTTDQTARDAAASAQTAADAAQTAADAAQADIDDHEANHPTGGGTTDQVARDAAASAQTTADDAQTAITDHEASTHNTDATARSAADAAQADIDDHEANHPTGGGGDGTPTPPVVLVEAAAYTAHGDLTIEGWRDYDFIQLFYTNGGTTYGTPPVNSIQLIALSPMQTSIGRNVALTLTVDATDDQVIALGFSSGNGVPSPNSSSTLTVIGWSLGNAS